MPRRETAARRYAEAAFEIGREDGTLDRWERDLATLAVAMDNAELRRAVEHPALPYAAKERLLRRVVGDAVGAETLNLLLLMIRRGRPGAFDRMVEHFGELLRRHRGVRRAEVRTALPLDEQQRGALAERLTRLAEARVEMNEVVDGSLIGGIAVRIGDVLYDASVRNRLERMRARLTAG
ncbi:MAG TPA: ATP synthase F1 subunit delta [candidate division Zixibacteria bacterium]|nr:ATP synthase F1 subunit delta [candidate division Zixibacteria bacterium]